MKIEHLQYLLAVVDSGSINKAAKQLFCTQPALTNIIKSIEKELGYPILVRTHNGVEPNELGKIIVSDSRFIINCVNEWKEYAEGRLTNGNIDVLCTGAHPEFTRAVFNLRQSHPEINVRITESIHRNVAFFNEMQQKNFRFGSFNEAPYKVDLPKRLIEKNGLQLMHIGDGEYAVFINSEDPLAKKEPFYLEDVRGRDIAVHRAPADFPYINYLNSVGCNFSMQLGDSASVILATAMGKAIAIRPISASASNYYVYSKIVTIKKFADCPMPIGMYFVCPQESKLNKYEKIFVDAIRSIPTGGTFREDSL